jgi:hypothetical protein
MAASLYIVVEGDDPGFDIFVNGHAIAREEDALERLAKKLGVPPLLAFFSADQNSMATLLDGGAGDPEWAKTLPPPQWFSAEDGLQTVTALLGHLRQSPAAIGEARNVMHELEQYEAVLRKAAARELRWQLAVSWR